MHKIYPNNHDPIELNDEDYQKVGRGMPEGYEYGVVTDQTTGKEYRMLSAPCNLETCLCAVTIEEVNNAKAL